MPEDQVIQTENLDTGLEPDVEYAPSEIEAAKQKAADIESIGAATTDELSAAPKYEPNFKFKVLDKENEFDDFVRTGIKDKETEGKVRELYEKAYGLDHVKTQRDTERQGRAQAQQQFDTLMGELTELGQIKGKDLGLFFNKLGLSKQEVASWVMQQAEAMDATEKLPESMKGFYNELETLRHQNYEFQKQMESLNSGRQAEALQAKRADLVSTLSSPEVKSVAETYDTRLGKPGSFEQLVIRHGAAEFETSRGQRNLSATEAAKEVVHMLGLQPNSPSQVSGAAQSTKVVTAAKPTVLPNVGSGTAAPTGKAPVSSLAELRKIAREMSGG